MRKDRAYALTSVVSGIDDLTCCEPGDRRRQLLLYDGVRLKLEKVRWFQ